MNSIQIEQFVDQHLFREADTYLGPLKIGKWQAKIECLFNDTVMVIHLFEPYNSRSGNDGGIDYGYSSDWVLAADSEIHSLRFDFKRKEVKYHSDAGHQEFSFRQMDKLHSMFERATKLDMFEDVLHAFVEKYDMTGKLDGVMQELTDAGLF